MLQSRQKVAEWIKNRPIHTVDKTLTPHRNSHRLKVKGWKKVLMKMETKKAVVATLIPNTK